MEERDPIDGTKGILFVGQRDPDGTKGSLWDKGILIYGTKGILMGQKDPYGTKGSAFIRQKGSLLARALGPYPDPSVLVV